MPTEVISTVGASGRDYATINLWRTGRQALYTDLVAADVIETAECYDDGVDVGPTGSTGTVIAAWTTDATRYVKITAAEGHVHDGTTRIGDATGNGAWVSGSAMTGGATAPLILRQAHTRLEKIRFHDSGIGMNCLGVISTAGAGPDGSRLSKLLFQGTTNSFFGFTVVTAFRAIDDIIVSECIASGKAHGLAATANPGAGPLTNMKFYNCISMDNLANYRLAAVFDNLDAEITNCISVRPGTGSSNQGHLFINELSATVTSTGAANIQDDTAVTSGVDMPDTDPNNPSFTDTEVVIQGASPFGAGDKVIFKSDNHTVNQDPRPSHLGRNIIRDNGKILTFMDDTVDLDGTKRKSNVRHIGPFVPVRRNVNVT